MSLTNPNKVVTEERLNEYHKMILPYLGGNSMVACGGGYAPIGTVIAYMGTRAPSDFLICDGTVYNIADYTELANFFELQFGSANFFGGDGATTFAVPDLRGEFLRGTGTNSHANQGSGANVGVHQDGTKHINIYTDNNQLTILSNSNPSYSDTDNDSVVQTSTFGITPIDPRKDTSFGSQTRFYTSRPTNTSVLYCIKAKSQGNGYSLDEQIVGTWIDGKPLYQKTIDCGALPDSTFKNIDISTLNANVIKMTGIAFRTSDNIQIPLPFVSGGASANAAVQLECDNGVISIGTFINRTSFTKSYVTLQYTKTTDV